MQTLDHVRFNPRLYRRRSRWTILLYEQNGVNVPIQLPNADLMSFIQVFRDTVQCQTHIETNLQKLVTLFAYEQDIQQWLANNDMPENLEEIKMFCHPQDRLFVNAWTRRHKRRFQNTTLEIIDWDSLNYRILLYGVDYLKRLHSDFVRGSRSQKRARRNYKSICHVLANYFWSEANS